MFYHRAIRCLANHSKKALLLAGILSGIFARPGLAAQQLHIPSRPTTFPLSIPVLSDSGHAVAWGGVPSPQPFIPPQDNDHIASISAGLYSALLLRTDGTLIGLGNMRGLTTGQPGSPDFGQSLIPNGLSNVVAITAGKYHCLALRTDGTVVSWGMNSDGQTNTPQNLSNVVAVAAGETTSLALKSSGNLVCWGHVPVPSGVSNIVAISAGTHNFVALRSNGTVLAWGNNSLGATTVPDGLADVVQVAAGQDHSLALKSNGTVVAWGSNTDYQGQHYSNQSIVPSGLSNVVAIGAGGYHSIALTADGQIVSWGANNTLQLSPPQTLRNASQISGGWMFSMALTFDPFTAEAEAQAVGGFVVGITILSGGYGYTSTPAVQLMGGGGAGATAVATMSNSIVTDIAITNPGHGYTNAPTVVIAPPPFPPRQATANVQLANGFIVGAPLTDGGFGYSAPPRVRFIGGRGSLAAASSAIDSNGVVTGITVTNPGSGYNTNVQVVIDPPFIPNPTMTVAAINYGSLVTPIIQLDFGHLAPYNNYQIEFSPVAAGTWTNVGTYFIPTATTSTQFINATGKVGFFRVKYVP